MINKNDYKVMEVLVNGKWVEADVLKELTDGTCMYLVGSKYGNGTYMMGGCVAGEKCREIIKTKTIVKPAVEIMKLLVLDGFTPDSDGDWMNPDRTEMDFYASQFAECGKVPDDTDDYLPEWLMEVPIDSKVEIQDNNDPLFN